MPVICRNKLQITQPIRRNVALAMLALVVAISSGCQTFNGSTDDPSQASNRQHKSKDGFIVGLETTLTGLMMLTPTKKLMLGSGSAKAFSYKTV